VSYSSQNIRYPDPNAPKPWERMLGYGLGAGGAALGMLTAGPPGAVVGAQLGSKAVGGGSRGYQNPYNRNEQY
jgi:hypothetical protein